MSIKIMENTRFQSNSFSNYDTFVRHKNCVSLFCNLSSFLSRFQHFCIRAFCNYLRQEDYCLPLIPTPTGCGAPKFVVYPKITVEMCCRRNRGGVNFYVFTLFNPRSYPLIESIFCFCFQFESNITPQSNSANS